MRGAAPRVAASACRSNPAPCSSYARRVSRSIWREGGHDAGDDEDQRHHQDGQPDIRDRGTIDRSDRDAGRRHALQHEQEQAERRREQSDLHAQQVEDAEPDQVDAEAAQQRHVERQGDHHDAGLIDEEAQHQQRGQHADQDRGLAEIRALDQRDQARGGAGEAQELRERGGADDDEEERARDRDRAAERLPQVFPGEAAIAGGEQDRRQRAERARFRRRRPALRHADHDDGEDRDQRHHGHQQIEPRVRDRRLALVLIGRRERRIERATDEHIADEQRAQDQARHDAADEEAGDRDAGEASEQDREPGRRNENVDAADRQDRADRGPLVILAREHLRQQQRSEHGGGRDRRARDRGKDRAGDQRDHREAARHAADDGVDRVDRFHGEAGVEQHLAHEHEQRDRNERKLRDRKLLVAHHLLEPGGAAEDQVGADDIDDEEDECHRQCGQQQADLGREHEAQHRTPVHGSSSGRRPGIASVAVWWTGGARQTVTSSSSACNSMASEVSGMTQSSHHCGKMRSLNSSVPSCTLRAISQPPTTPVTSEISMIVTSTPHSTHLADRGSTRDITMSTRTCSLVRSR